MKLTIVGKGQRSTVRKLHALCGRYALGDAVSFVGLVDQPMSYFQKAAITLVCSADEAFGRVAVEAMAMGCPVVATNNGGLKEIITTRKTGLFYEHGNYISLADSVAELLDTPTLYDAIAALAMADVRVRFSLDEAQSATEAILMKIINNPTRQRENAQ